MFKSIKRKNSLLLAIGTLAILTFSTTLSFAVEVEKTLSKSETRALESNQSGTNVRGESGGFLDYLNDDQYRLSSGDIALMDIDDSSQVVLGGADDAPAGVSFKQAFENNVIE